MFSKFRLYKRQNGLDFRIHYLTLSFRRKQLELQFSNAYFRKNLHYGRLLHLLSVFFYAIVGMWDALVVDPSRLGAWIAVIATVALIFMAGLASSYFAGRFYSRYWQPLFAFYVLATGGGFTAVTVATSPHYPPYNFVGVIFCLFFCYTFIRLTFVWAALAGTTIVFAYAILTAVFVAPPVKEQLTGFFYMFGINLLGMMVCYSYELMARRDFILNDLLKRAEDMAQKANNRLEHTVSERTRSLNMTNRDLKRAIQREKKLVKTLVQDAEENAKLENKLRQAYKMEAIGTLASGIAHDFNNILSSIIGFTELALEDVDKGSLIEDNLQEVYTAGKRAKDLVAQILAFARQSGEELKPVQVDIIVKEVVKFIRSSIPSTIEIKSSVHSESLVFGNQTQIHQIMMNLCTNAAQAMEKNGGRLLVALKDSELDEKHAETLDLPQGHYLEISVSDTGPGIEPEIIDTIFEPYFTTKAAGEGTGMGLAMVHGIVESYNGKITVDSTLGQGALFTIYLPVKGKRRDQHLYEPTPLPQGTERILLVDDEAPIARMCSQGLERLGYRVEIRTSSLEALELFRAKPEAFDLVISDMTMPNMTGDELAIELMIIKPSIPVILCTGYSKRLSDDIMAKIGIRAIAYKPIVKADLAKTIRNVLDGATGIDK